MKKFIRKGILFYFLVTFICVLFLGASAREPARSVIAKWTNSMEFMDESGMLPLFDRARQQDGTTGIIIGDSICNQMFSGLQGNNPETDIIASNAAFMITGQYVLAEEYLRSHPQATDVYLIMHPLAMTRTFDLEWSYRYSIMPCVQTGTLQYLDSDTREVLADVYGEPFIHEDMVRLIEKSPVCQKLYLSYIHSNGSEYVQDNSFEIADQYVHNLYSLCAERDVRLHLYAAPVAEYYRGQMEALEVEYQNTWMFGQYPDYMDGITYYPSEWAEDLSHFSGEYAERDKLNEMIRVTYAGTVLLENLQLED